MKTHHNPQSLIPCISLQCEVGGLNRSEPWFQWADQRKGGMTWPSVDGKTSTSERHWRWLVWCRQQRKREMDQLAHETQKAAVIEHSYETAEMQRARNAGHEQRMVPVPDPVTPWNQPVPERYENPELIRAVQQIADAMARNETAVQFMQREAEEQRQREPHWNGEVQMGFDPGFIDRTGYHVVYAGEVVPVAPNPVILAALEAARQQVEAAVGIPEPVASCTVCQHEPVTLDSLRAARAELERMAIGAGGLWARNAAVRAELERIRGLGR